MVLTKDRAKESARRVSGGPTGDGFRNHLLENWSTKDHWDSEVGRHDIDEQTVGRLIYDRHEYVPRLNQLRRLDGARVFEIGWLRVRARFGFSWRRRGWAGPGCLVHQGRRPGWWREQVE